MSSADSTQGNTPGHARGANRRKASTVKARSRSGGRVGTGREVSGRELVSVGREYLRVSVDKSGVERSIGEQHAENRREADRIGVTLGEPYHDVGSASRHAQKTRKNFDRLVADLEADRFGADVLVLWESSRGSRKVSEWVTLIELCEQREVRIHVTTHGRTYDPANPRDRRSLLEDSVDSEYESSKLSQRAKRHMAANAAEGKPHGRVPYGYQRRYDPSTRRFVAQEPHPEEAPIVRELFERIKAGHSIRSIALDFERRGITNKSGRPFGPEHLRSMAVTRLYAGERVHVPGRTGTHRIDGTAQIAQIVPAQWDALVPKATFLKVQAILTDPSRRTYQGRPGRAVHFLSLIARCAECGGPLTARTRRHHHPEYSCRAKGCVRISKANLDSIAEQAIIGYLSRPEIWKALASRDAAEDDELAAIRDNIASIRAELNDLADQVGQGEVSATLAARAEPAIVRRLKAAQEREAELATPSVLRDLITPGQDIAEHWKSMPLEARRQLARIVFSPEQLGQLCITRTPKGQHVPTEERIQWHKSPDSH